MNGKAFCKALSALLLAAAAWTSACGQSASFTRGWDDWSAWGEGESALVATLGHEAPGCVSLQCGSGQTLTLHRAFTLAPGRYRVSAWLRGDDIQLGQWKFAVWLFYDTGKGTQSVVKDLSGTFNWSRVTYTIDVPADSKKTQIWYRLKAPGLLWLDDITVEPYVGEPIACQFEKSSIPFPRPNPPGQGVRCENCYRWWPAGAGACASCGAALPAPPAAGQARTQTEPERLLLGFEPDREAVEIKRHSLRAFCATNATQGTRSAQIKFGGYNNLVMKDPDMHDWSGYDYVGMDVFNPLPTLEPFSVVISDPQGSSYWNQLNHVTQLAPGWNRLRFHVNRFVGERGSVKVKRYLDLHNVSRMWLAVAPENKRQVSAPFLVDNIRLLKAPPEPAGVDGMKAFDFVKEKFRAQRGFLPLVENLRYSKDVGFGFINTAFWRSHDSEYADTLNRDGIFVRDGTFAVDVPNGRYVAYLCVNVLGYWNEHFWSRRKVSVEGQTVLDETRPSAAARAADFLRFQDVEPEPLDDPYDLYLRDIFKPLVAEVTVTDGRLDLAFSGDESGVCLNWLIVAPAARRAEVDRYLAELRPVQKDEFANLSRQITRAPVVEPGAIGDEPRRAGLYTALVDSDMFVRPGDVPASQGKAIRLEGGIGERPVQALMIRSLQAGPQTLHIEASPLLSADGKSRIEPEPDWVRRAVNQYQCHSYNHETFEIAPRYLRRIPGEGYRLPPDRSLLAWLQVPVRKAYRPGIYRGELTVRLGQSKTVYPIELTVCPYTLPPLDVGVGFFGLDLVGFPYNPPPDAADYRIALRRRTLDPLASRGFTTWTGLPEAALVKKGDSWVVEAPEVDALMAYAQSLGFTQMVFTYGGGLSSLLQLDNSGEIAGLPQAEYRRISAEALKAKAAHWLPLSITFSDEAAGYSSAVDRDMKRAEILKTYYPFLRRSGATAVRGEMGKQATELNQQFTDLLLSSQTQAYADGLKASGAKWGFYNISLGLFTYDRPAFGEGLFVMRKHGMDYLLNWALSLANNYPYYDLDGREHDAMMLFPRTDGELGAALKFEWAAQGVEDCRMLMLLEQLARAAGPRGAESLAWVDARGSAVDPYAQADTSYPAKLTHELTAKDCDAFRRELRKRILELLPPKGP